MHIVESFALNTGLKIDKPYIYEKYVPLSFQGDYVTLQPFGKQDSRKYDHWEEVINILSPKLDKKNIKIIQLGVMDEPIIKDTVDMRGRTDFNQAAYLIKNSLLHFGADSFGVHIASGYNKKIVSLYSNMYPSNCGPYWSDKKDYVALEPPREKGQKPCYCPQEWPKTINEIYPEKIAKSVLNFLGIKHDYLYETIHIGLDYQRKRIEVVPFHFVTNWKRLGVDSLIMRMDEHFDEGVLQKQLNACTCSIVTDKPIKIQILQAFKKNIAELIYLVKDDSCLGYIKQLKAAKINFALISYLEGKKLNRLKLKFIDYGQIIEKKKNKKSDIEKVLKGKDLSKIYYKSSNLSVIKGEVYSSRIKSKANKPAGKIKDLDPQPIIDRPDFWENLDSMILLEKSSQE